MKNSRAWTWLLPLTLISAATFVFVSYAIGHKSKGDFPLTKFSKETQVAMGQLRSELIRRFSETDNVDFGLRRVIEPGVRLHMGSTMNQRRLPTKAQFKPARSVKHERGLMIPENRNESAAIETFAKSHVDVAIYTIGKFEYDNPQMAELDGTVYTTTGPNFLAAKPLRVRGPAYVDNNSAEAPHALQVVDFARKAWKGDTQWEEGSDGWVYFAHRVGAPSMTCANCHGDVKHRVTAR